MSREQYEEHSERDQQTVPLAVYHFENVKIPLHWHRELELIQTFASGTIELEGERHFYREGDILCVNKEMLHRTQEPMERAELLVFDLRILLSPLMQQDASLFLNRLEAGGLLLPVRIGREHRFYPEIWDCLEKAIDLVREKADGWELQFQIQMLQMMEWFQKGEYLQENKVRSHSLNVYAVKESINFMKQHYGRQLTIKQLAEQAALSPAHYIRVFQRCTGQTPFVFLNEIRLHEAAVCLRRGMTVTETAMEVGIPNISYFIRLFRMKFAQTPKQYQLSHTRQ